MPENRMGYREALCWIIWNDDCEWLKEKEPMISVSAAFLADMFRKDEKQVIKDLMKVEEIILKIFSSKEAENKEKENANAL